VALPVSIILVAAGAILVWGVTEDAEGLNVDAVGVILMIVGLIGFLLTLLYWDRWGWGAWRGRRAYVEQAPPAGRATVEPRRRTRVVEEEVEEAPPPPPV
jgi:hypothetical protein